MMVLLFKANLRPFNDIQNFICGLKLATAVFLLLAIVKRRP